MLIKKIKTTLAASVLGAMIISGNANAEDKPFDFGKIYIGCGLGGIIGGAVDDKTVSQVLAISTNITWDLGTTASISYYSSEDTCANYKAVTAAFIHQSYEKLEKEIAMGKGEYFDTLAALAVGEEGDADQYQAELRKQFAEVVADESYLQLSRYEKVEKLYSIAI